MGDMRQFVRPQADEIIPTKTGKSSILHLKVGVCSVGLPDPVCAHQGGLPDTHGEGVHIDSD